MTIYQYYVYAYLREDGTPYYIGKGKNNRAWSKHRKHIPIPSSKNLIIIMESNLSEIGALALERRYIQWYGRKDLGTGILRNLSDGGEGTSGIIFSEEHREKIRLANLGKKHSQKHRENNSNAQKGKKLSDEHKKKIGLSSGKSRKGLKFSEKHRENLRLAQQKRWKTIGKSKKS